VLDHVETNWGGIDPASLFRIACNHHRPSSGEILEQLIAHADRLASGHDRRSREKAEDDSVVTGLISPMACLGGRRIDESSAIYLDPAANLTAQSESILPANRPGMETYRQSCSAIAKQLIESLNGEDHDPGWCLERVDSVVRRYCSAVPASRYWKERPDTSLYDHSRAVAAFAACLGVQHLDTPFTDDSRIDGRYRLLTLRLKGIQSFIFRRLPPVNISGASERGRARELRARSCYVALIAEQLGRFVTRRIGLPSVNALLCAGGSTTLLLPATGRALDAARDAIEAIHLWLLERFAGTLRLESGLTDVLSDQDFGADRFPVVIRELESAVTAARTTAVPRRLRTAAWADVGWLGATNGLPTDTGAMPEQLRTFGRLLPKREALRLRPDQEGDLPVPGGSVSLLDASPSGHGEYRLRLFGEQPWPSVSAAAYVPRATTDDLQRLETTREELEDDWVTKPGDPLPFSALAQFGTDSEGESVGPSMLGALKADVDRLGYLMAYGLSPVGEASRASLGRLAAVSRTLDGFFKGFVDEQLRVRFQRIYTVFAGGDDLFLIGPWYDMVRFSIELQAWFDRFACNREQPSHGPASANPRITLSAGLAFFKPAVPVRIIAETTEELLERAKNEGRDRIALLATAVPWSVLREAWSLHTLMMEACTPDGAQRSEADRSLIRALLDISAMARRAGDASRTGELRLTDLKWRSQLRYHLARRLKRQRQEAPGELHEKLVSIGPSDGDTLMIACTLTLYRLRGESV